MIVLKGLFNIKNFKKYLFNVFLISLVISIVYIFSYNINLKLDNGLNKEEYRTAIVVANNYDYLINNYDEYIEKFELNENELIIIFKDVKYLNEFLLKESNQKNVIDVSTVVGESMDSLKIASVSLNILLICLYIFLFVMIIMFNLDFLNKSIIDIKLYIYLGFNKLFLYGYYVVFLTIIYSLLYILLVILVYLLIFNNIFHFYFLIIILLFNFISMFIFDKIALKNVK